MSQKRVVVVGQGYVGLPLAMAAVEAGFFVTGIDNDEDKVRRLSDGCSPVGDVSDEQLAAAIGSHGYTATTCVAEAQEFEIAVITVPTPLADGAPDLSFIESAGREVAPFVTTGCTVILESTTYPGTTEELLLAILEKGSGLQAGTEFFLGYSPERIDPGNKEWTLSNTPKVISGINKASLERVRFFYESLGIPVVHVSGTREAEMTKLLENTFRHVNIALVNELSRFSNQLGVDLWEAIDAASTKPFGFMSFFPGPGVGGHCLPIDPTYLSWAVRSRSGEDFRFVSLANDVNKSMPDFTVQRSQQILGELSIPIAESSVLIVGLAYKPNVGDMRESPALEVARLLEHAGASVFGVDDHVREASWPPRVRRVEPGSPQKFDLAVLLTAHDGLDIDWVCDSALRVLDTRHVLKDRKVDKL